MKPIQFILKSSILLAGLMIFMIATASATTYYSYGNKAANSASYWWTGTSGSGSHPSNFNTASDIFIVQSGSTYTTGASWTVAGSIQVLSGATLVTGNTNTWTLSIGGTTSITGTLTLNNSAIKTFTGDVTVNSGGILNISSTVISTTTMNGNLTVASGGTFNHNVSYDNGSVILQVNGDLDISGTYSYGTYLPAIWMNGSGTHYINTGTSSLCKLLLRTGNFYANGTVTIDQDFYAMWNLASGTFHTNGQIVNANWGVVVSGGTFYVDGGTLNVGNTVGGMLIGRTLTFNGDLQVSSGTMNISGGGIYLGTPSSSTPKGTCEQSGGNINVAILDLGQNCTFTQSGGTNTINGSLNLNYSSSLYNQTATSTLNIAGNLSNNGVYNSTGTGTATFNIAGNFTNNNTFTATSSSIVTFNGSANQSINGTSSTVFNNLTINNAAGVNISNDQTVNSTLTLTTGNLTIGSNNLILGSSAAAVAGSPFSANNMIVADGGGEVRKNYSAKVAYFFPIGDATGTTDYSPISLNYTSGTFAAGAYSGVKVTNAKHPNNASTTDYLNRYWTVSNSGITSPSFTVSATYLPTDVNGTVGNIAAAKYTGALPWVKYGVLSANTLTTTAVTNTGTGIVFSGISNQLPLVSIPAAGLCAGGSTVLSPVITNGTNSMSYSWSPSTGLSSTTIANPTANPAANTTYTLNITDGNGFTSTGNTTTVSVNALPTTPTASVTSQPTCALSTGTITITAPTGAGLSYSTDGVTYSNTIGIFSGMNSGNYNLTVKNSSGCISSSSIVTVNAQPATPVAPTLGTVTQPTCSTATGTFTISNYNASYTYAATPSTGVTISGSTVTAPAGSYTITATLGSCTSATSASTTVNTQPATPVAPTLGTVTQPTCSTATGTFTISNYNALYTYAATPSTGVTISGSTVTAPAGSYTITATLGSCTSATSASTTVNAQPATPVAPTLGTVTQPTCSTPTGTFTISNYNASYTYAAIPSTGVTISGSTVTAPAGSYTITATLGSCTSATSASTTVNAQPATPVAPTLGTVTQPTCSTATGTFTISNYNALYTYAATPSTGVTISGSTVTAPAGSYTITATLGSCTSATSASKTVNTQPATPVAPTLGTVTQPTCSTPTGTFTISNYNASYTYAATPSTGVTISGSTVTAPAGSYTITATLGSCTSATSASKTVNAQPATPVAPTLGTVTQPTCSTATGTFTISNYNASYTYAATPSTGVTISGSTVTAPAGSYTITATLGSCTSATSASKTVNAQPATPVAPTLGTVTQPTCSTATGTFTISNYNASYTYAATPSTGVTISGSTVKAPAGSYTITATLGCTSVASASTTVNALIQPSATISYPGSPFCPGTGNILPVISGTSGGVFTSTTGLSINGVSGTINVASSAPGNYTITYTIPATGACTVFTTTTSITIIASGSWSGGVSTDWNDPSNWVCGPIPNSDIDVTIPAGLSFYPVITSGTGSAKNITIQRGASLTISGGTLQISGAINNSGNFDATNGTIEMNGPDAQSIAGSMFNNKTIENLVVNNMGSGLSVSSTANDTLKITGLLSFGNASAVLNTGDNITLVSNSSGTAAVGVLGGINSINGNVIVERYINTGTAAGEHPKSWQFLAAPTTGQSIKQSWMENGTAANYYGTMISGPGGTGAGFDISSPAPSMKYYNYQTKYWTAVANTSALIDNVQGYMVFVRGDRTVTGATQAANPTVLRTKGILNTGTLASIVVHNNNWGSIGNPYASPIDFTLVSKDAAIDNKFYVLDPYLYGSYGTGGYQTLSAVNNWQPVPGGTVGYPTSVSNSIIQSGQAFFVHATSADSTGTSNVRFMENCKSSNTGSNKFSRMAGTVGNPNRQFLRASLITSTGLMADGNLVAFDKAFSNGIDGNDALKMVNSGENFSVKLNGQLLIIDAKSPVTVNDTISYYTSNLAKTTYKLIFAPENMQSANVQAFLVDKFLSTETPVSLTDSTFINVTVTSAAASSAPDRFLVVFRQLAALPVTVTSVTANLKNMDIVVNWNVQNESGIQQYQVEKSTDGIQFNYASSVTAKNTVTGSYSWTDLNVEDGIYYYRIKIISVDGKASYTQIVKVISGKSLDQISVYPNPVKAGVIHLQLTNQPEGNYSVRLFNSAGQLIVSKKITHAKGTSEETIICPNLAKGIYQLEIVKTDGSVEVIKVMN